MNIKSIIVYAALLILFVGCDQPSSVTEKTSEPGKAITQGAKGITAPGTKALNQKESTKAAKAADVSGGNGSKQAPAAVKESADTALSDTISHARDVTKSQKSESRQHGQKAEDEMMMELGKGK